jgi:hypothetical protein
MNYFYYFFPDIGDVYEAWDKVCVSDSKNIRELKDEIEILEKGNP